MKKIVSMLLILAISFSLCTAYANTEKTDVSKQAEIVNTLNEGNVYTLSLEEAKKLAYTDNRQIAAVELKKHSYDLSVDSARLNKKAMKYNEYNNVSSSTAGVLVRKGYYVELYRSQSELAKKELEKVKAKIDYDVTEKYYNYKLTERLVEVCKTSYELAKTNLEVVKKQFDLGLAAQIDIDSASAVCEQAKAAAENYERTLDIVEENLFIKNLAEKFDVFVQYLGERFGYGGFSSSAKIHVVCKEEGCFLADSYFFDAQDNYTPEGARYKLLYNIAREESDGKSTYTLGKE